MNDKDANEIKFSMYSQRPESDLPKELLDECLGILNDIESRKADSVNWEERAKMDEVTKRSGNMLFDEKGDSDTFKILNGNYDTGDNKNKEINVKEAKPKDEKEEALMAGLADIMGQIEKLDEAEQLKKEEKKDAKN